MDYWSIGYWFVCLLAYGLFAYWLIGLLVYWFIGLFVYGLLAYEIIRLLADWFIHL